MSINHRRTYSESEQDALRSVSRREWGEPFEERGAGTGPAHHAAGDYWPVALRRRAAEFEWLAPRYRLAADALEREIAADPRCRT